MRISDWSSDVCSSDLADVAGQEIAVVGYRAPCRGGIVPIAFEIAHRSDRDLAAHALRHRPPGAVENREIDQWGGGAPGRIGLGEIIVAPISAAPRIGLGQAIADTERKHVV